MSTSETPKRTRRGNMEGSTPRQRKSGLWQANFVAGYRPSGQPIRQSVYGQTKSECTKKLREAINDAAKQTTPGTLAPRLIEWLDYWLAEIAPRTAKSPQSLTTYANKINSHVRPSRIAAKRLNKLSPSDFELVYAGMREPLKRKDGTIRPALSESSVAGLHRVLRRALNVAVKRDLLLKNPILKLDAPSPEPFEPQVYSTDEVRRMISAAQERDDEARWLLNLMLGPRQGEALGLTWSDIDFETGKIRIERELFTQSWKHGCQVDSVGKASCGRRYGSNCPDRQGGGYFTGPPKSASGVRSLTMPAPLREALESYAEAQRTIRLHEPWTVWVDQHGKERDLVFCRRGGLPMYPKADWLAWRSLLEDAKVPVGRPHDGRHTAATTMLLLGVPPRVVMEILGWSQISMLTRYQHVLDEMHQDVASKLTDHWTPKPPPMDNIISLRDRLRERGNLAT